MSKKPPVVRERERKFDLDPGLPVPRLDGVGPVVAQREPDLMVLDASYFDTDDHRLLRAGVTLRRRTGGADAGWHLKLPANGARDEVQLPLSAGRNGVPRELAKQVRGLAKNHKLVEIAHLRTERHQHDLFDRRNRLVAVLTDDEVTGEAAGTEVRLDGWRELEIELEPTAAPGLLDTLGTALTKAGARPAHWPSKLGRLLADPVREPAGLGKKSTAADVVLAYLRTQVDAVRRHDIGVRHDAEDSIHQLRVAMRRLRSALSSFRRVVDRERTKEMAAELKWAAGVLSDARDIEVQRELFDAQLSTMADSGAARTALDGHFDQTAAQARVAVRDLLNDQRYAELLGTLEDLAADPPLTERATRPARKELRKALARAQKRLVRAVDGLDDAADADVQLHEVRKKAKQARCTGDTVRPVFGRRVRRWRKSAKAIQSTLGDYHDLVTARELLHRLTRDDTLPGPAMFGFGSLHERTLASGAELRDCFTKQWRKMPRV